MVDERFERAIKASRTRRRIRLAESTGTSFTKAAPRWSFSCAKRSCRRAAVRGERYEVTSHFAVFGESVSKASVTVRVSNAFRSESEQGTGSVDALERSLRQCRYTLFPAIADELEGSARSVARMLW